MCEEFMKHEMVELFGDKIYEAYSKLPMAVMKADLWRYCIIYKYGGIYADVDAACVCDPSIFTYHNTMLVCAPENNTHLCQWCFSAPAKSPILKHIIQLSMQRILDIPEVKGEHIIHFLTGPAAFTDGVEYYLTSQKMTVFQDKIKYAAYKTHTMICFKPKLFHNHMIHHLFAGQDDDGWTKEREKVLL